MRWLAAEAIKQPKIGLSGKFRSTSPLPIPLVGAPTPSSGGCSLFRSRDEGPPRAGRLSRLHSDSSLYDLCVLCGQFRLSDPPVRRAQRAQLQPIPASLTDPHSCLFAFIRGFRQHLRRSTRWGPRMPSKVDHQESSGPTHRSVRMVLAKNAKGAKKRLRYPRPRGELRALCERNSSVRMSDPAGSTVPGNNRSPVVFSCGSRQNLLG